MEFSVKADVLFRALTQVGKALGKTTMPILEDFLLESEGHYITLTASDNETRITGTVRAEGTKGSVAVPAKLIMDAVKQYGDMMLQIEVDDKFCMTIKYNKGSMSIPCADPKQYPLPFDCKTSKVLNVSADVLFKGITKTLGSVANDELRPVMNGVYINGDGGNLDFVGTDAHKLVLFSTKVDDAFDGSFILPAKPAMIVKGMLQKVDGDIVVYVDGKNAVFTIEDYVVSARLIEGNYPNYKAVIPTNNPHKVVINKQMLLDTIKRVSVCASPTTSLIRMNVESGSVKLFAQDLDFSLSASETIPADYDGEDVRIGLKADFLLSLLNNIDTENVQIELADERRAAVINPVGTDDMVSILSPMMLN